MRGQHDGLAALHQAHERIPQETACTRIHSRRLQTSIKKHMTSIIQCEVKTNRLVEEDELGVADECNGSGQLAFIAAIVRAGDFVSVFLEQQLLDQVRLSCDE